MYGHIGRMICAALQKPIVRRVDQNQLFQLGRDLPPRQAQVLVRDLRGPALRAGVSSFEAKRDPISRRDALSLARRVRAATFQRSCGEHASSHLASSDAAKYSKSETWSIDAAAAHTTDQLIDAREMYNALQTPPREPRVFISLSFSLSLSRIESNRHIRVSHDDARVQRTTSPRLLALSLSLPLRAPLPALSPAVFGPTLALPTSAH